MDILYKCAQRADLTEQELLDDTKNLSTKNFLLDFLSSAWFTQWQERQMTLDQFACSITAYFRG